jgi:hypothetical protein
MACQGRPGIKDEISQEAKAALANAAKVRRMRRLDRDGCSKSDAVRRRLRYIAAERKLEPADIAKIIMRRLRLDDLAGFAQQHGISMDWRMFGDISRHPKFAPPAPQPLQRGLEIYARDLWQAR